MQLKKLYTLSKVTAVAIMALQTLIAENYVSVEYLHYDENDDRVSVSAPSLTLSYDIGTDYNIKADIIHDTVSGATPVWQADSGSGASSRDNSNDYIYKNSNFNEERNAASIIVTTRLANRDEIYTGLDYSRESDFDSKAVSIEYLHYTDNTHNQSINFGLSYAYNEILSYDHDSGSGASQKETATSINILAGLSQILSTTSAVKVEAFAIIDDGYLTNPYSNIVRDYGTATQSILTEIRPDSRTAYGFSLKYNTLLSNNLSYLANYRFYTDDWEINSHTLDNNIYYEFNDKLTLGLGLRYYTQSKASFYQASKNHFTTQTYGSSDERLSNFNAFTYKASVDYKVNDKISYNVGAQFYTQSTRLDATILSVGMKYRF